MNNLLQWSLDTVITGNLKLETPFHHQKENATREHILEPSGQSLRIS